MAFSLGIISYTISRLVETLEDFAEEVIGDEIDLGPAEETASESAAKEVFAVVSEKSKAAIDDGEDLPRESDGGASGMPADGIMVPAEYAPVKTNREPRYIDVQVTEHFLKYNYSIDDIANTRLRNNASDNGNRLFRERMRMSQRDQGEVAKRNGVRRKENLRDDEIRRQRRAEAGERGDFRRSALRSEQRS